MEDQEKRMPVKKYRANGLVLNVWENEGNNGAYHSLTLQRNYKDSEGAWKTTTSFRMSDMPTLVELCSEAFREFGVKEWVPGSDQNEDDIPF